MRRAGCSRLLGGRRAMEGLPQAESDGQGVSCKSLVLIATLSHIRSLDAPSSFVLGGSHGGFLAAHLTSKHPQAFTAAVLRNPVISLGENLTVTDIPDWSVAASLEEARSVSSDARSRTLGSSTNLASHTLLRKTSSVPRLLRRRSSTNFSSRGRRLAGSRLSPRIRSS